MKKFLTIIAILFATLCGKAQTVQGWPSGYGGVMFQAFYWDSYSDTQWTNLTSQADTLAKYFDLVWVPQSGYCNTLSNNMGYYDIWWFDQKSAFGTADQLKTMIQTFKSKGLKTIADVVINHKNGNTGWIDFPNETYTSTTTGKTYKLTWNPLADICSNDEANTQSSSPYRGKITGAADTGEGDGGCRDLDHTSTEVQNNIKTYLDFLQNEMGYSGFRYDMTKGYAPKYTKLYNESAKPAFSVGEYWDGNVSKVKAWVDGTGKTSAAFDFPMKYLIKAAFGGSDWSKLSYYNSTNASYSSLAGQSGYSQYAVTFVDNHDTGEPHANPDPLRANIAAANAYILAMPGTPCVWLSHWKAYKTIIKKLILARKLAGITNTSSVLSCNATSNGATINVKGTKGNVLLVLGSPSSVSTTGYQLAVEGDNFKYYVSNGLDLSGIKSVVDEPEERHEIPSFCKVNDGETCAFFEVPASWGTGSNLVIKCWRWDKTYNYTTNKWPGSTCIYVGTASNGCAVYKWTYNSSERVAKSSTNDGIIFSGWKSSTSFTDATKIGQQNDMAFKNGNYYGLNEVYGNVIDIATGINDIKSNASTSSEDTWYSISGMRLAGTPTQKGIYIHNGKKIAVR